MAFRIRQIDYTADHRRIVRDRMVEKDALTVGRAGTNDIPLPDLAVEPEHATIAMVGSNRLSVKAVGTLGFDIDGKPSRDSAIDTTAGAELRFASYRLAVRRDEDGAILIEVENMAAAGSPPDPAEDKRGFSFHSALKGKRVAAWSLAIAILALFLVWPISSHLAHLRAPPSAPMAAIAVKGDKAWNPGPLSLAHQALNDRCEACHVKPFESVRSETCQSCHKNTQDHADPTRIAMAHGRAGLGQAMLNRIGDSFGREKPGACVDCHVEHQGKRPMDPPRQKFCSDCHATLRERLPDTKLGNASDFGTEHPQFAALVTTDAERGKQARVPLDGKLREDNGLTFSHRVHLDRAGGVAKMALTLGGAGYGKPLDCQSCHRRSADGVSFQPVTMQRDCEACHSLAYAKSGGTTLKLRHGDLDQALADLRRAGPAEVQGAGRNRPGAFAGGIYSARFGSAPAASDPLAKQGLCGECHTPVTRAGRTAVKHVALSTRYLKNGWFDHSAHNATTCTTCHAAPQSDRASDVLVPGIKVCRDCHLGEAASPPKVPSGCVMCHAFHTTAAAPPFTHAHRPRAPISAWPQDRKPEG